MNNKKIIIILALGVFSILNTEMGYIGLLPYISQKFSVTIVTASLLISLFALGVAIAGPIMPLLTSHLNKKRLMLAVLAIFTISNLIAMITNQFSLLLIARVIPAFLHPVYCALAFSIAAELAPQGQAPKAVARVNMGVAGGMVLGVPISNFLASNFNLPIAFSFFAIATGLVFILTLIYMPSLKSTQRPPILKQLYILKRLDIWLAITTIICLNGAIFGIFNYMADYYTKISLVPSHLTFTFLLLFGLCNLIGSYLSGNFLSIAPRKTLWLILIGLLVFYGTFYYFHAMSFYLYIMTGLWGILAGMVANLIQYHMTRSAKETPEFANGLFLTSANLGSMLATSICGGIIMTWGMNYIILVAIILVILSGLIAKSQFTYERKKNINL